MVVARCATITHEVERRVMAHSINTKIALLAKRLLAPAGARRLVRQEEGAATVEFALVAAPFLALMFAILETGLVFFAGQTLETVASDSARLILTGQAQNQGMSQSQFNAAVCAKVAAMFDCTKMMLDVQTYSNFSSANTSLPVDSNGNVQTSTFGFNPGGSGDIVVMRLMYPWPTFMSLLGFNLSNMSGQKRLLMATVSFRNEPF
jgi:Flp pilus assembly protein TadG